MMTGSRPNGNPTTVRFLDHTADVGFDLDAPTLESLFDGAAQALNDLILGLDESDGEDDAGPKRVPPPESGERTLDLLLEAADAPALLADWLRELVFRFETEGLILRDVRFERLDERKLQAHATLARPATRPVREIKGVTYHGLVVQRASDGRWRARVILDV